ncbi:uncharacterized protein J4E79_009795 [Alternaria viburni]|uniref:uncharacterized protein n=1 Tax=Alternaria viburni TaxID=566460 RepID=UPI0020C26C77|nr:uncharacterized protein J4E79_009795 [Alternaria viburni]KAI4648724.1 hypothetical protein J4E79_009795 [Alternaria viburni]
MGDLYASCPLDRTRREIRLLTLEPNNDEDITRCSLQTYSPENCPSYTALSYTWGADVMHTNIEINGVSVPIRENLWDFVHQQLLHGNYGPFWIDAICIQQSEVDERNHQVRLMSSIYSEAGRVLIWLGKEGDDSDIAMQILEDGDLIDWTKQLNLDTDESDESDEIDDSDEDRNWPRPTRRVPRFKRFLTSTEDRSITALCNRRYWSRMWIIQEVMLADYLEIHCGSKIVSLSSLVLSLEDLASAVRHLELMDPSFSHDKTYMSHLDEILASPAMDIAMIRGQSTPRVAEYGQSIKIDYRKSAKDVLIDLLYHGGNRIKHRKTIFKHQRWEGDELFKFAQLLSRVLDVPLSETEIQFHVSQSESVAMFRDWEEWN